MTNVQIHELYAEVRSLTGLAYVTSVGLRTPSDRVVVLAALASHQRVDCSDYGAALASIDRLISMALYAGISIDRPAACAAVWSVPDGAPIEMAFDNLGCSLSSEAADRMERWASERALGAGQIGSAQEPAFQRL